MKNSHLGSLLATVACMATLSFTACNQQRTETENEATTTDTDTTASAEATGEFGGKAAGTESSKSMMSLMRDNMDKMRSVKMTGDPDYDFAQLMKMHHQGAIRMSEEMMANGQDSTLKRMADRIISNNNSDITRLQTYLDSNKPARGDTASTMKMMQPMRKMMADMPRQKTGTNTDQNYAHMMVQHHQSGVDMAQQLLKQGKSREMKNVAQKIIDEQQKEIKELKGWLGKNM